MQSFIGFASLGIIDISLILLLYFITSSGILDSPLTIIPLCSLASRTIFSLVTGNTLPVIAKHHS